MKRKARLGSHKLALAILAGVLVLGMTSLASARQTSQAPQGRDNDITRRELLNFDRFLDSHPDIAKDLRSNPGLANDPNYLSAHPELQQFLDKHPGVREELRENPKRFLYRERRFDRRGGDITRGELRNFDAFLDNHPDIEKDLKQNPGLANDPNYLAQHPDLQQFLDKHPGVRQELKENPKQFFNRERRFERSGRDVTRGELRNFDAFLDKHPQIDKDLQKTPGLANDPNYLAQHPELKEFLDKHPGVRGELKEHPRYFEHRVRRYERHERGKHHRRRQ